MNRFNEQHRRATRAAACQPARGFVASGRLPLLFSLIIVGVACLLLVATADARLVKEGQTAEGEEPLAVFTRIAAAWEEADVQALADLVHESGLTVDAGGGSDRGTHYSPSQAFYYFKNQFQSHRTLIFTFDKMQDATTGDRVHGMAVWKRRRPDSERIQEKKLVCVLARQGDRWRLAEINTIR